MTQEAHVVTEAARQTVRDLYACGIPQPRIAERLGIDDKTLRKYYREDLDITKDQMISDVAKNLYQDALNGDEKAREFWLKCQGKWSYHKDPEEKKQTTAEAILEKIMDRL